MVFGVFVEVLDGWAVGHEALILFAAVELGGFIVHIYISFKSQCCGS